jgi:hypothetical protein
MSQKLGKLLIHRWYRKLDDTNIFDVKSLSRQEVHTPWISEWMIICRLKLYWCAYFNKKQKLTSPNGINTRAQIFPNLRSIVKNCSCSCELAFCSVKFTEIRPFQNSCDWPQANPMLIPETCYFLKPDFRFRNNDELSSISNSLVHRYFDAWSVDERK